VGTGEQGDAVRENDKKRKIYILRNRRNLLEGVKWIDIVALGLLTVLKGREARRKEQEPGATL